VTKQVISLNADTLGTDRHDSLQESLASALTKVNANFTELYAGQFGGIYIYDGSSAISFANGSTPILVSHFAQTGGANGLANGATPEVANNRIVVGAAGTYRIEYSISFASASANLTWEFYAYNGAARLVGTGAATGVAATDVQCVSGVGFASCAANAAITLKGYHNGISSVNLTVNHANLTIVKVGL